MKKNFLIALSLSITIILTGCQEEKQVEKPIRPVKIVKVSVDKGQQSKIILPASINELKEVKLAFRVGGPLIKLNNIVGNYVQKGDIIAQIDPRDFKIAVESAESRYLQAKTEYERYKNLLAKNSVSKSLFDQMETNYTLAKTSYESAENALIDTELKAPFSGYINTLFVENFEKINPGAPIISLLDCSSYEVNAWISAQDVNKIKTETKFVCVINNGVTYSLNGKLKEIGAKSGLTKQSYPISVLINAPKNIKLRAGMTATLEIIQSNKELQQTFLVPVTAVFSKDKKTSVWIFNENTNTVTLRSVEIGDIVSSETITVINGLQENEHVVTAGVHYLYENQRVKMMSNNSN